MSAVGKLSPDDQAANQSVLMKLLFFSFAMALAPIGTYFGSLSYVFKGNSIYAAISAVIVANIVLVGYVTIAFREDKREREEKAAGTAGFKRD